MNTATETDNGIVFTDMSEEFDEAAFSATFDFACTYIGEDKLRLFSERPLAHPQFRDAMLDMYSAYCAYPA
jgi:hypothetical protein